MSIILDIYMCVRINIPLPFDNIITLWIIIIKFSDW